MRSLKSLLAVFSVSALILLPDYAVEAEAREIRITKGRIKEVDTFRSKVVVEEISNNIESAYEETAYSVTPDTKISKGTNTSDIFELNVNDPVTLEYYYDESGAPILTSIMVYV